MTVWVTGLSSSSLALQHQLYHLLYNEASQQWSCMRPAWGQKRCSSYDSRGYHTRSTAGQASCALPALMLLRAAGQTAAAAVALACAAASAAAQAAPVRGNHLLLLCPVSRPEGVRPSASSCWHQPTSKGQQHSETHSSSSASSSPQWCSRSVPYPHVLCCGVQHPIW